MLTNHFKIAWRSLLKDKQFSLLNILGLCAGLACTLLIFLWVKDELSYDKFFANDDRLYKLFEQNDASFSEESSGRLSTAVKERFPEVAYAAAVAPAGWFPQNTLSVNDKNIKANGQYAEKDYFHIFSFQLLQGNANNVLSGKSGIVLSDELAVKLFGTTSQLIGKPVQFDHDTTFYVSGVFKKMPANSSQQFDFVLSFDYFRDIKGWVTQWNSLGPLNFVLLKKGTSIDAFNKKVAGIVTAHTGNQSRRIAAIKFSDTYLYNHYGNEGHAGQRIQYIRLFIALAVFILVIACINFMNLSTAKAARRLKEVGIKKVVGARRSQLIAQFLTESLLLTIVAMAMAVTLAVLLLPAFNQLTGKAIQLQLTWQLAVAIVSITVVTGFLAGSYPALYISGFTPLAILKGTLKTSLAELLSRKGLVVFQFVVSTILIVAVTVIYQQVQFIRNSDPGYNKENVLRFTAEGAIAQKQEAFMAALQQLPGVVNASTSYHSIVGHTYSTGMNWPGRTDEDHGYFEVFGVGRNFIETMGMQIKAGRSFSKAFGMDSTSIIVNEAAVKAMNLANPVGVTVELEGKNRQIIGVMKDFHFESMHEAIKPSVMILFSGEGSVLARIKQANTQHTIAAIEKLYTAYNPGFPFTFNFLDAAYQKQYEREARTATLSGYFAGLAILISCLGLFGLAAFTAQKRQKEIGIRKVVGASAAHITTMLSADFLKLVGLALVIAFPLAWWLLDQWLQGFAYRIELGSTIFVWAGMLVFFITMIAIGFQTVKAAMANPVTSLRSE